MKKPIIALIGISLVIVLTAIISSLPAANVIVTEGDMEQATATNNGKVSRQVAVNSGDSFTVTLYAHLGLE